jgi:membrane protease YdiL (CAAX protease family)
MTNPLFEAGNYFIVNILILFLAINFNLEIGTIYAIMAFGDLLAYYIFIDAFKFNFFPFEKDKKDRFTNLIWAMGAYVVFSFVATYFATRMASAPPIGTLSPFEYVASLIAGTFSATPILYGSKYVKLFVWGILIPIVETRFFFRTFLQMGLKVANIQNYKFFSIATVIISAFFGAVFVVFHLVAKGITNNSSLLATFIFGFISVALVLYLGEVMQAIFLHIITNTIATMSQLGMALFDTTGILTIGVTITLSWLLLFYELPLLGSLKNIKIGG